MNWFKKEGIIGLAIFISIASLFLPAFLTGKVALLLVIVSALKWELKGGFFSAFYSSLLMLVPLFLSKSGFSLAGFFYAIFIFFMVGLSLGQVVLLMNGKENQIKMASVEAREHLQRSIKYYQDLLNSTHDPLHVVDDNLVVVFANQHMIKLHSFMKDDTPVIGTSLFEYCSFLSHTICHEYEQVFRTGKPIFKEESTELGGQFYHLETTKSPIFDEKGRVKYVITLMRDISYRKKAEEDIRKGERNYQEIYNSVNDAIFIQDSVSGDILDLNEPALRMYGCTKKEEMMGPGKWDQFNHVAAGYDQKRAQRTIKNALTSDKSTFEWYAKTKKGKPFWVEASVKMALIDGEERLLEVVRDITDRKEIEESLWENQQYLNMLISKTPAVIYAYKLIDGQEQLTYISDNIRHVLGYEAASFMSNKDLWRECLHPDDKQEIQRKNAILYKGRRATLEYRFKDRKGNYHWLCDRKQLLKHKDGTQEVIGTWWDITDRKEYEESLQAAEETYRNLFLNSQVGLFRTDIETGMFLDANDVMAQFAGYKDRKGLLAKPVSIIDRYVNAEDRKRLLSLVKSHGEFRNFEAPFRQNDGSTILISFSGKLISEKGWIEGVSVDITHRKEAERQLANYTKELEKLYLQLHEEINKARQVHQQMLPKSLPQIEGLSMAAYYQPAERIGGDFYDIVHLDKQVIFYLSDVSGHGLDGSMLSLFVKHTIKGFLSFSKAKEITPDSIFEYLSRQFNQEDYPGEYFICFFLGILDLETMELTYSSAGFQDRPLVRKGDGTHLKLISKGLFISPLFPVSMYDFKVNKITMTPGTTIFFNTDGLTEQRVLGKFYMDRLPKVFYEHAHLPPHVIHKALVDDFRCFNHDSLQGNDDITFLVMQVQPHIKKRCGLVLDTAYHELNRLHEKVMDFMDNQEPVIILLTCLNELVVNAMEHGNKMHPHKKVNVELKILEHYIQVSVEDQGKGFNWQDKIHQPLDLKGETDRGRGIAMTRILSNGFYYNSSGNEATFFLSKSRGY